MRFLENKLIVYVSSLVTNSTNRKMSLRAVTWCTEPFHHHIPKIKYIKTSYQCVMVQRIDGSDQ